MSGFENVLPTKEKSFRKCVKDSKVFSTKIKIKRVKTIQKILRNRYQDRSIYYFTSRGKVDPKKSNETDKYEEDTPFYFPKESGDFSYRTKYREDHVKDREKAKGYTYYNRPNYTTKLNEGKLERLHVPSTEVELPGRSVTETVDPEYFTIASGKPITEKFKISSYLKDLQSLFLIHLQIGYKKDETLLIEEQYVAEKKQMQDIKKRFDFYAECYDKFLAEDHSSSLKLLKTADLETKKSKVKREKIRNLLRDCGWYRTKILILDEQWRIARIFQKFLYQVSPLWWRNKYDFIHKSKETGEIDTSDTSLFERTGTSSLTAAASIITIIDQFIEDVSKAEPPRLHFTDPNELLQIFFELERNNLLALLQCEELTQPAQQMETGLERARELFMQEVAILQEHLKYLEDEVVYEENRSRYFEQKAKEISSGLFRELIVDKYTLNLYVNVEDCFEVCVAPNDGNLTLLMMMKGIEQEQESLMVALDKLPNEIVLKALQTCYREDARVMKEAHDATKLIVQIENLMKTLRKSLEPVKEGRKARKLLWRSEPPVEKMEMQQQSKALTKEEMDYLYFFTDFCAATDDPEAGKTLCAQRRVNINV
ncbi:hypothetical protein RUM44_001823 [Polyplax serrata]|uniref:DUF4200 domain-containing protein n=1 Tax=Polyplax serrata TaxID=468196 RepID=A0ABR1AL51_POLSC